MEPLHKHRKYTLQRVPELLFPGLWTQRGLSGKILLLLLVNLALASDEVNLLRRDDAGLEVEFVPLK
jgi:hypothetical protein